RRHTRCLSDWSSDVCSSDLHELAAVGTARSVRLRAEHDTGTSGDRRACRVGHRWESACRFLALDETDGHSLLAREKTGAEETEEIGRASCRERGWEAVGVGV